MKTINKLERRLSGKKVLTRKLVSLGLSSNIEEISMDTKKIVLSGGYRLSGRDDRKRFGKTSGKRHS